ncbi:Aste57867_12072 [Aphanomyces stellatus]|uniref:Aste57867_12072 protein n=1 Tax=Aphanomyces stellatus TaxID=120398 RepID=A0A485KV21_9STRA|nr:hypothetical protein As57867_012027 [Aphanomyces stellatus]VFT88927.1 Aste57867_12072 [Aphanomyces stellatus]
MMEKAALRVTTTMDVWTATHENDFSALEHLLREGEVPADERNSLGETALHVAASRGWDGIVDLLLRHGANPNAQDQESGYTPLHRSFLQGHLNTSLLLLNGGAHASLDDSPLCVVDHDGMTPLDLLSALLQRKKRAAAAVGGEVYTFGKVDFQLGYHLPHGDEQYIPRRVKFQPGVDLVNVSAAMYHTLAVSSAGHCYSWGFGKGGRLGTGSEFNCIHPVQLHFPQRIVVKASAGENHSLALTSNGQVYSWGSNSFGQLGFPAKQTCASSRLVPKRIDAFKALTIVDIAAASCHSAAITSAGHVFTWGSNKKGQLGRKEGFGTDQGLHLPKRVESLLPHSANPAVGEYTSVVATKIAVSCFHTCVVLACQKDNFDQGQVWQWGWGAYFPSQVILRHHSREAKLRQQHQNLWLPRVQQFPISIVDISSAPLHSIGLSSLGNVYTWGHGPNPLGSLNYVPLHDRALSVAAAKEHCAVVLESGDVYTWGCGTLGHEGRNWQPIPKRVSRVKQAAAVVAGPQHTVVLVAPARTRLDCGMDTLVTACQHAMSAQVSLQSVVKIFNQADMLDLLPLQALCRRFVADNLDAVLEMAKNADEWPIELDEIGQQRQLALEAAKWHGGKAAGLPSSSTVVALPVKKDIEKKMRSLRKRVDQLNDLELLVTLSDAQKAKLKRKPALLQQIKDLAAQLPQQAPVERSPALRPKSTAPVAISIEPKESAKRMVKHHQNESKATTAQTTRLEAISTPQEIKKITPAPTVELESKKAAPPTEPKAPKTKAKFVPLTAFLSKPTTPLMVPNTPPMTAAASWPSPSLKGQPMPAMKLNSGMSLSVGPASSNTSSSAASFSLESFMKPARKGRGASVEEKKSKSWQTVSTPTIHSLAAIQAAEVVTEKQTWNLKTNSWGLCQEENVNLSDIQMIELAEQRAKEERERQDCEFARQLQAQEYEHAARQTRHQAHQKSKKRSKPHQASSNRGQAAVRTA